MHVSDKKHKSSFDCLLPASLKATELSNWVSLLGYVSSRNFFCRKFIYMRWVAREFRGTIVELSSILKNPSRLNFYERSALLQYFYFSNAREWFFQILWQEVESNLDLLVAEPYLGGLWVVGVSKRMFKFLNSKTSTGLLWKTFWIESSRDVPEKLPREFAFKYFSVGGPFSSGCIGKPLAALFSIGNLDWNF